MASVTGKSSKCLLIGFQFFKQRQLNHTNIASPSCFTVIVKASGNFIRSVITRQSLWCKQSHWYNGDGVSNYEVELPGQLKSIQTGGLILMEQGLGKNVVVAEQ